MHYVMHYVTHHQVRKVSSMSSESYTCNAPCNAPCNALCNALCNAPSNALPGAEGLVDEFRGRAVEEVEHRGRGVARRDPRLGLGYHAWTGTDTYAYSLGLIQLQPGCNTVAAWATYGCSLGCKRLQPGRPTVAAVRCLPGQPDGPAAGQYMAVPRQVHAASTGSLQGRCPWQRPRCAQQSS